MDVPALRQQLAQLDPAATEYATVFVDQVLQAALDAKVSDVHFQPHDGELRIKWRLDGVLQELGAFPTGQTANVIARLKVLAQLLTYQTEVPQEGRLQSDALRREMRVSTMPTIFGERVVVRLFTTSAGHHDLTDLGYESAIEGQLRSALGERTGALLLTGPAGSGKTTSAYACLRYVAAQQVGRNIVSLEDPVEVVVPEVAQSQVNPAAEFTMTTGLKSMLRQDPEVIFIGEVRDAESAILAYQAALTGQLMLTTFHAGSACEAVSRLVDIGIEPYLLRSGTLAIVHQRLVRRTCDCAVWSEDEADKLGLPVARTKVTAGCAECQQTGYQGRSLIAELLQPRSLAEGREILIRGDAQAIEDLAVAAGMATRWDASCKLVEEGITSAAEVRRVLGFGRPVGRWDHAAS